MIQRRVARSGLLLGSTGSPVSLTASLPLHTCVSDPPHRAVAFLLIELLSVSDNVYFSQASVLVWYLSLTLRLLFGAGLFHGGRRGSEAWLRAAPAGHGDGGIPPGHQKTVSLTLPVNHSVHSALLASDWLVSHHMLLSVSAVFTVTLDSFRDVLVSAESSLYCLRSFTWGISGTRRRRTGTTPLTSATRRCFLSSPNSWRSVRTNPLWRVIRLRSVRHDPAGHVVSVVDVL